MLIGTAVVGATTMIFSIIILLTDHLKPELLANLSILYPPFLLGLITGGAVIYWFTGASMQAVTTGAYRAVEFIKANIKLEGATKASVADSKKVVEICTQYAQKGMFNIFLTVFFATLAFAFFEPYFFIGYLISIALFGLYQAIFMANAGGAWDNAKKIVEVELKAKGTPLHDATVVGDTVGDPFKDTSSVALNPIIKFTTLFGLLAVELAVSWTKTRGANFTTALAAVVPGGGAVLRVALLLRDAHRRQQELAGPDVRGQGPVCWGHARTLAPFLFCVTLMAAIPDLAELNRMIARFAPVELHADASKLSAGDQKALAKLLDAARVIDDIFLKQVWSGNAALRAQLARTSPPLGNARLHYFDLNKGPWSELDDHAAFLPGVPEKKLPGANFYPESMTKTGI